MRRAAIVTIVTLSALFPLPAFAGVVSDYFSPAEIARADAYRTPATLLALAQIGLALGVAAVIGLGRGQRRVRALITRVSHGRGAMTRGVAVAVAVVVAAPAIAVLPLAIVRHDLDARYGLARDPLSSFLRDRGVALAITFVVSLIAALGVVAIARRAPRWWPAVLGASAMAFVVAGSFLLPVLYEPAFDTFRAADPATAAQVADIAQRFDVAVDRVLIVEASRKTERYNAYVSGIGATRRVVLYDTLVEGAERDLLGMVVAHELAHVANRDVRNATALSALGALGGVGLMAGALRSPRFRASAGASHPSDPGLIPFLAFAMAVAALVSAPIVNGLSRHTEARADRDAIAITGQPDAAIRLEVALAKQNLADLTPNATLRWFFATHPSTIERIRAAEAAR